jgi:uncharacterized protein YndB with AHSA1/START domain
MGDPRITTVWRVINVPPAAVYRAYLDQDAVATWLPPGSMKGAVHAFEPREGGRFKMSLVYPDDDSSARGKTSERTDTFQGRFAKLVRDQKIVWATQFESDDPSFAGEMIVTTTLAPVGGGTEVTIVCENIPRGIRLEDNEAGCPLHAGQACGVSRRVSGYAPHQELVQHPSLSCPGRRQRVRAAR